jgi:hypothetical protein
MIGMGMNLAAIRGFCLVSLGFLLPLADTCIGQTNQPPATAADSGVQSQKTNTSPPGPTTAPKPHLKKTQPKKTTSADCSTAPAALNPSPGASANLAKSPTATQSGSGAATSASGKTGNSTKTPTASHAAAKPCPPHKKIVRNGGSDEPEIELLGGTPADQAASERSTEELTAATKENLKKISGRQLSATEQETLEQIKQFMQQSKEALAAGDAALGHNLAVKARLLSEELVKP